MSVIKIVAAFAFASVAFAACAAPQSPEEQIQTQETAALAPLKAKYAGTVMGFDFKDDATLLVSLDVQNYIGLDDDTVGALKRDLPLKWKEAWSAAHPGKHAMLTVRAIDFVGKPWFEETVKA